LRARPGRHARGRAQGERTAPVARGGVDRRRDRAWAFGRARLRARPPGPQTRERAPRARRGPRAHAQGLGLRARGSALRVARGPLVLSLLEKEPGARPASAVAVARALVAILGTERDKARRWPLVLALALVVVLVVLGVAAAILVPASRKAEACRLAANAFAAL